MNDAPTPRTDAVEFKAYSDGDNSSRRVTASNFARQLERELNEALKEGKRLNRVVNDLEQQIKELVASDWSG